MWRAAGAHHVASALGQDLQAPSGSRSAGRGRVGGPAAGSLQLLLQGDACSNAAVFRARPPARTQQGVEHGGTGASYAPPGVLEGSPGPGSSRPGELYPSLRAPEDRQSLREEREGKGKGLHGVSPVTPSTRLVPGAVLASAEALDACTVL